jgi:quercetin dioxygenase-like cupin family protein
MAGAHRNGKYMPNRTSTQTQEPEMITHRTDLPRGREEDRCREDLRPAAEGAEWNQEPASRVAINRCGALLAGLVSATVLLALASFVTIAKAEPPSGVTPTVLARGTYEAFEVRANEHGALDFKAEAKAPMDVVVRRHDYGPHSTTGWHSHPGPIFITVTQGTLTYYENDGLTCTPHVVSAGQGFLDDGHGHVVRNETDEPAQDVSVITAPVGGAFRTDLDAPNPVCGF